MIQRIQSLLLLIAAAISIVVCFITIGDFTATEMGFEYTAFKLTNTANNQSISTFYVAGLWIISAILSLVTIFLYKNRARQVKFNGINMLVMLAALAVMLYIYPNLIFPKHVADYDADLVHFSPWVCISLIPAVCLFFANKAIKRDENKVRAADRLR